MKHLVLTLWFVLSLSSIGLAGVEYVTEQVCHAMSGCVLDTKTGECPDCVIERLEVAHTHEEKPVVVEKPVIVVEKPIVRKSTPKKVKKVKWTCIIKPCEFIDENGNLIENS